MNIKKVLFLFILTLIGGAQLCLGMQSQSPLEQQFLQQYAPPKEIIALIEANKKLILRNRCFGAFKELPGIYFKGYDIERLINAELMDECIKYHKLTCLNVAKKYVYNLDGKWIVLADMVEFNPHQQSNMSLSFEEIQQLALLAEKTAYYDWGSFPTRNWVRATNNKLFCVDTENGSFSSSSDVLYLLERLYVCDQNCDHQHHMSLKWVRERQKQLESKKK